LSLKRNRPQPDANAAKQVELNPHAYQGGGVANPFAWDVLLDMPGVNFNNMF
jgi:hypothetical protein